MLQRHVAILLVASALAGFGLGALAADVPDTLEQRLLACAACHGKMGEGTTKNETYPRLAGKPEGYLYNQLLNFSERRRRYAVMNHMVAYLSPAYLQEIARYYARQRVPYAPPATGASSAVLARWRSSGDPRRFIETPACVRRVPR